MFPAQALENAIRNQDLGVGGVHYYWGVTAPRASQWRQP